MVEHDGRPTPGQNSKVLGALAAYPGLQYANHIDLARH